MKIGILTINGIINYGAMLQSYALQEYLKKEGHNVELIDYDFTYVQKKPSVLKKIVKFFIFPRTVIYIKKRIKVMLGFEEKYIKKSKSSYHNGIDETLDYDAIVFGSDQIWNSYIVGSAIKIYLGDFQVKEGSLKIAYAASAGAFTQSFPKRQDLLKLLNNFDSIGARERELAQAIQASYKNPITTVLDPTLLVDECTWDNFTKEAIVKEKYILIYEVTINTELRLYADKLSKKFNMKVIHLWNGSCRLNTFSDTLRKLATPDEFINLFKYANIVLTTSFHGTAFSLIFKKDFYYLSSLYSKENRIRQILGDLNLSDRIIKGTDTEFSHIDWEKLKVTEKLNELKKISSDFLRNSLNP